jgi:hypothetical protein
VTTAVVFPVRWTPFHTKSLGFRLGTSGEKAIGVTTDEETANPMISQIHVEDGPADLAMRLAEVAGDMDSGQASRGPNSRVRTLGEMRTARPEIHEALTQRAGCQDMLALWAIDSEFHGVGIQMPSSTEIALSPQARKRWQALTAHIAAAHRLREVWVRHRDFGAPARRAFRSAPRRCSIRRAAPWSKPAAKRKPTKR